MELVRQAHTEFSDSRFAEAVELYQKAGNVFGHTFFKANISLCKRRFEDEQNRRYQL
jgi:hypothetical protein